MPKLLADVIILLVALLVAPLMAAFLGSSLIMVLRTLGFLQEAEMSEMKAGEESPDQLVRVQRVRQMAFSPTFPAEGVPVRHKLVEALKCPSCGGPFDPRAGALECPYCGCPLTEPKVGDAQERWVVSVGETREIFVRQAQQADSFVEEVERLARERLRRNPDLTRTRLYLTVDGDDFLCIEVNGRKYSSVEEIADPRVRKVIAEAVKDWEIFMAD